MIEKSGESVERDDGGVVPNFVTSLLRLGMRKFVSLMEEL
jgi:hypothetical protein